MTRWYAAGLHFECAGCGRCCSGPESGYVWVDRRQIRAIADFLGAAPERLHRECLRRVGPRTTVREKPGSLDCVFLKQVNGRKGCAIYPVRPAQCRQWPFWAENLASPDAWNRAATKCPGMNRGRLYSADQVEAIRADGRQMLGRVDE
jgi:Fe-S-cluster containining protein